MADREFKTSLVIEADADGPEKVAKAYEDVEKAARGAERASRDANRAANTPARDARGRFVKGGGTGGGGGGGGSGGGGGGGGGSGGGGGGGSATGAAAGGAFGAVASIAAAVGLGGIVRAAGAAVMDAYRQGAQAEQAAAEIEALAPGAGGYGHGTAMGYTVPETLGMSRQVVEASQLDGGLARGLSGMAPELRRRIGIDPGAVGGLGRMFRAGGGAAAGLTGGPGQIRDTVLATIAAAEDLGLRGRGREEYMRRVAEAVEGLAEEGFNVSPEGAVALSRAFGGLGDRFGGMRAQRAAESFRGGAMDVATGGGGSLQRLMFLRAAGLGDGRGVLDAEMALEDILAGEGEIDPEELLRRVVTYVRESGTGEGRIPFAREVLGLRSGRQIQQVLGGDMDAAIEAAREGIGGLAARGRGIVGGGAAVPPSAALEARKSAEYVKAGQQAGVRDLVESMTDLSTFMRTGAVEVIGEGAEAIRDALNGSASAIETLGKMLNDIFKGKQLKTRSPYQSSGARTAGPGGTARPPGKPVKP